MQGAEVSAQSGKMFKPWLLARNLLGAEQSMQAFVL